MEHETLVSLCVLWAFVVQKKAHVKLKAYFSQGTLGSQKSKVKNQR
jgi:hypothetical protein